MSAQDSGARPRRVPAGRRRAVRGEARAAAGAGPTPRSAAGLLAAGLVVLAACGSPGRLPEAGRDHARDPGPHRLLRLVEPGGPPQVADGGERGVRAGATWQPGAALVSQVTSSSGSAEASYTSPPIDAPAPFTQALPSWNADVEGPVGFVVELRVARGAGPFTEWVHLGEWGDPLPRPEAGEGGDGSEGREGDGSLGSAGRERRIELEQGRVDVDVLTLSAPADRIQFRVHVRHAGPSRFALARFTLCLTDGRRPYLPARGARPLAPLARLPVPFRSQRWEAPELVERVCSPTSVAMVLAYRGVDVPTAEVARLAYDDVHDLFGNWPRAVQAAYTLGVPGWIERFDDWDAVRERLAGGQPLVISIQAAAGELTGAPYPSTEGHLLVLTGIDEHGDLLVNDPAADSKATGRITYARDELERAWMGRGGTAYVLLAPEASARRE